METTLWNIHQPELTLPFSGVHVWSAFVSEHAAVGDGQETLSKEEIDRASRFRDEEARRQFIIGRVALRQIIGSYLGLTPEKIKFKRGSRGKLSLAPPLENEINFNLSHADDLVLMAFSRQRELGIDVEKIEAMPEAASIAEHFFPQAEAAQVKAEKHPEDIFFKYWTRKEAVLKSSGRGIDDESLRSDAPFPGVIHQWQPAEGYIAALAVLGSAFEMKEWQWTACMEAGSIVHYPGAAGV